VSQDIEEFSANYARAREIGYEHWADESVEIADNASNDWMERARKDGEIETVLNREHVSRSELRINTRKWMLSKLLPKKFGDRVELTGKGGGPIEHRIEDARSRLLARFDEVADRLLIDATAESVDIAAE
jgi:hypothetical protein